MNPLKAWNRFMFGPISARPLGAFRIVYGLVMLGYLGMMTVEFDHWYTGAGLLRAAEAREAAGPLRISPLQYVDDPAIAHLFLAATAAAAVAFTLGWRTRLMSVLFTSACSLSITATSRPTAVPTPSP